MVREASVDETEAGRVPAGEGWFVLNARDARWVRREGRGMSLPFTGWADGEEAHFPQVGVNLFVLRLGEPMSMYHREADQEDFLVLAGEALLVVEGEERRLRQWDFVHCPPQASHVILGAGETSCVVLAIGSREHADEETGWGSYTVDEAALRHGAGVAEETHDARVAYARFPASQPTPYQWGWLPGE
jgi:uncharacterized cupin superfamily protein